jgi:hypothetical protein
MFGILDTMPWHGDRKIYGLLMNFVRLTDLAVSEYEIGRSLHNILWNERHEGAASIIGTAVRACSHFETSITAAHRAVRHFRELKNQPNRPAAFSSLLPSTTTILSKKGDNEIEAMRHAIQHLEDRIVGSTKNKVKRPPIREGEPIALKMRGDERQQEGRTVQVIDRLELGSHCILFRDLQQWLTELHGYARALTEAW